MTKFLRDYGDWYWQIGADTTQFYASGRGVMVPANDSAMQTWLSVNGNVREVVDTVVTLGKVLAVLGLRPTDAGVLASYQQSLAAGVNLIVGRVLFNHENRIRALESKAPITAAQFTAAVAALL